MWCMQQNQTLTAEISERTMYGQYEEAITHRQTNSYCWAELCLIQIKIC